MLQSYSKMKEKGYLGGTLCPILSLHSSMLLEKTH